MFLNLNARGVIPFGGNGFKFSLREMSSELQPKFLSMLTLITKCYCGLKNCQQWMHAPVVSKSLN
jgi:hypothetical protein